MKPVVFVHTNEKQMIGAKLAEYALKTRSKSPEAFDVRILSLEETPHLYKREGCSYLRKKRNAIWHNDDLQSFSPLRMMIPQLMEYKGRALVIDPDIFAVGDVFELLSRDMEGKAIICRNVKEGYKGNGNAFYATSSMLLDCEKLTHWKWDEQIDEMFNGSLDYGNWISLTLEDPNIIGDLEEEWNHFDVLNDKTKLVHNTERSTQPWKTGLPVDFDKNTTAPIIPRFGLFRKTLRKLRSMDANFEKLEKYQPHPDPNQELFFLRLLKECINSGNINENYISQQVSAKNLRPDIFSLLEKVELV